MVFWIKVVVVYKFFKVERFVLVKFLIILECMVGREGEISRDYSFIVVGI